jgi:DNA replicative helicase MCM subunit Mcm2 (Cdc46/Mcm family)
MSVGNIKDINVPLSLQKLNINRMGRSNQKFLIQYEFFDKDNEPMPIQVYFDLKPEFFDTLEEFRSKASKRIRLSEEIIQRTIAALSNDEYCQRMLQFYEIDSANAATTIGDQEKEQNHNNDNRIEQESELEDAYASSVSDPDYTDEGLPLLSVTSAIRKDPMRMRVSGIIDTVRKPFKLLTKVYFVCRNQKCTRCGSREPYVLDTPIFSLADMPIAFDGGADEYNRYIRCSSCRSERDITPDYKKFENAKTIELRNLNSQGKISAIAANSTLALERLTVIVFGKHTLSVGFGEEVEIVGNSYVLASGLLSSRFGAASNPRTAADNGRAQPILYAKRIRYTKRERELKLTDQDIKAIKKFASFPNLIARLVSMMSPQIYGHEDVKLGNLLVAVGPAPVQKDSWYRRSWLNAGLFGDKGTGKTTLAEDAAKLLPGSQTVSGQHSTGKGIVAIAEKEGDSGAVLRAGAATLANNAICFIDEIGTMNYEDQNQFLSLMENGYFNFNKLGIRQRIEANTSFIVTANPMTGDWQNSQKVSQDEIPLKAQLLDRLDFSFIFRRPRDVKEIHDYAENKFKLSKKHFNLDYLFLRKYLSYIRSNSEFLEIDFNEPYDAERLKDFWINLISANADALGNRSFETVFRTAKSIARLMLKKTVDSEVVAETIKFLTNMFDKHGSQIIPTTNYRDISYLEICKIVKDHSQNLCWAQQNLEEEETELSDITFNQAAEVAAIKNENIRHYLGENFRSNNNRAARHLRQMFREGQDKNYDGGKIKVVSIEKRAELRLRWIPNIATDTVSNTFRGIEKSTTQNDNKNQYGKCDGVTGDSGDTYSEK